MSVRPSAAGRRGPPLSAGRSAWAKAGAPSGWVGRRGNLCRGTSAPHRRGVPEATTARAMNGVSVVIPTAGGRADVLARSLRTILDDPATDEVVVVMDQVDALTEELLQRIVVSDSRLRLVAAPQGIRRLDRGQANRDLGVREARGDLIVAIDDDVEAGPGLVGAHAERHARSERLV